MTINDRDMCMRNVSIQTIKPLKYSELLSAIESSNLVQNAEIFAELKRALADHKAVFAAAKKQIKQQLEEAEGLFSAFEKCEPLFEINPDKPIDTNDNPDCGNDLEDSSSTTGRPEESPAADEQKKNPVRNKAAKPSKTIEHQLSANQKACPCCGKNMHQAHDKVVTIIRLTGFSKERHVLETARCLSCETNVEAKAPQEKTICSFTIPAAALLVSLRYAYGLPSFRIEDVCSSMGYRIPDSTQWDIFETVGNRLMKFHKFLKKEAAQTTIAHMDDTSARINSLTSMFKKGPSGELEMLPADRRGVHTTGFLAEFAMGKICLFHSGLHHAGEFFEKLMASRTIEYQIILMMDASSSNTCKLKNIETEVVQANCNSHSVRKFKEVEENPVFKDDASIILELYAGIYKRDDKLKGETAEKRLEVHKSESLPEMLKIKKKIEDDFANRKVEPSSPLAAITNTFSNILRNSAPFVTILARQSVTTPANAF